MMVPSIACDSFGCAAMYSLTDAILESLPASSAAAVSGRKLAPWSGHRLAITQE
jgi:hypothetical protein